MTAAIVLAMMAVVLGVVVRDVYSLQEYETLLAERLRSLQEINNKQAMAIEALHRAVIAGDQTIQQAGRILPTLEAVVKRIDDFTREHA